MDQDLKRESEARTDVAWTKRLEKIPRISLGYYPTPLEEMPRLREALGKDCPRLFIKRDDYTGAGLGGNKVRKVEYALAREIAKGTKTIVTIGGEKSNHARITAAACARLGLRCILVLNVSRGETEDNIRVPASRFAYEKFRADVHWVTTRDEREFTADKLARELNDNGEPTAFLPLGLSMPIGALGYVRAYAEVKSQFEQLGIRPDAIFHSSSSGGTQAGLVAGDRLFGDGTIQIVGVSPDDLSDEIKRMVKQIANGTLKELGETDDQVTKPELTVLDAFIGKGYGIETDESIEAEKLIARSEGILLDPLYTSKALAAMINWISTGRFTPDQTILFWHTGGQLAHFYA